MSRTLLDKLSKLGIPPPPEEVTAEKVTRWGHNTRYWAVRFTGGYALGDWTSGIKDYAFEEGFNYNKCKRQIAEAQRKLTEKRNDDNAEAAEMAKQLWHNASECTTHPYLQTKKVKAHGLKIDRQTLLIPLQDERGNITSLQKIWPNPQIPGKFIKGFLKGSRIQGCSFILGSIADEVAICEGYATGAAIYEITGLPVVIAFSSNNLQYVAGLIAKKHPKTKIIVAADNDRFKPGNPGLTKAKEAAAAVGAKLVVPVFENDDGDPTDFNDLYVREGAEKVRNAFLAKGCNQRCAAKDEKEDNKGGDHTPPLVPLIPPLIPPPSSNEIQVFFYNQKNVRTAQNDGKIQWILKDICDALGLNSPHKVADRLDESEKGRSLIPTPGGVQKLTTVTESGLYRIIHESRKPETRKFERWITHEVLPRIRKHEVCVATESAKTTLSLPKNAQESTENIRKADETKKENDLSPDDEQEITDEHIPDNFRLTDKALYYVDKRLGSIRLCSYLGIANLL